MPVCLFPVHAMQNKHVMVKSGINLFRLYAEADYKLHEKQKQNTIAYTIKTNQVHIGECNNC